MGAEGPGMELGRLHGAEEMGNRHRKDWREKRMSVGADPNNTETLTRCSLLPQLPLGL